MTQEVNQGISFLTTRVTESRVGLGGGGGGGLQLEQKQRQQTVNPDTQAFV